jgi:hypothetical protein
MSISHQQYANLANHAYNNDYPPGPRAAGEEERITLEGVTYKLREYTTHPSGYQGMIFQRVDTGEVVVTHRGTEFDNQPLLDGALADGGMIVARTNRQADEAIELTRRALNHAKEAAPEYGHIPEVTVTGHSLGGCLAQITAHHFGLRGETFNAYGAASLDRRIPEGGDTVIHHVMAADLVGAASPHFGQFRLYATEREIEVMRKANYHEDAGLATPSLVFAPLKEGFKSHRIHNFLNVGAGDRPDIPALPDPYALATSTERPARQRHDRLST